MSENIQLIFNNLRETESKIDQMLQNCEKSSKLRLLHQYNDIKDATQIVINHIANIKGTSVTKIHEILNLGE